MIAALRVRDWFADGIRSLVIATASLYIVKGATSMIKDWIAQNWRQGNDQYTTPVANRDMWEALIGEVERYQERGLAIFFWSIPREHNLVVEQAAKAAASVVWEPPSDWEDTRGIC